ncbi:CIR protein PIR protein [Plasmodium vinckei]|uniref:CIR protein PIR protein n=1 Tax=Plasmodium vinckei TaxID=5860 RepID=A0A6V7SF99_PLAVN|nr:CIR protein PIR protein [Plasmodium vinckei]
MWLGDKLFKIDNDYKATLEESYKNNLENHTGNFKYWTVINSKRAYKGSNVSYISELYSLLNCICNLITEYKKNPNSKKVETNSKTCYQKFINLYDKVKECYTYFHLLKNLKNIYDGIRNDAIQKDNALKAAIKRAATKRVAIRSDIIKNANITPPIKNSSQLLGYVLNASTISLVDLTTPDWDQRFPDESDQIIDFHTQPCLELRTKIEQQQENHAPKSQDSTTLPPALPQPQQGPPPQTDPLTTDSSLPSPQNGSSSQTSQIGGLNSQNESKGPESSKINTSGTNDNKGSSSSGNENPDGESSDPASTTSGGSFNFWSSIFELALKGKEYHNKASEFIEQNKENFKNGAEKITGAYNIAVDNLKDAYDKSSKYFNKCISNVIDQLSKIDTPSKSGDKQSGPCSPMGGGNISNHPPSNPPPIPPINPKLQKQVSLQPQSITQQSSQIDPPKHKTADNTNLQLVKSQSTDPNLKTKWNILPTTWNGSMECKPKINFINTTLVCCTSEQCSLTGISVILVLIPIILSIAYKCLSREWEKKSEKKNMKRIINLANGNRKTKIVISSYDKKKDLKPVINLVGKKKDPLLNIYKFMQADPIPFINLFFLLIFFVYKRNNIFWNYKFN